MRESASSTTAKNYMQSAMITALHPPKVWEQFVYDVCSILRCTYLENLFYHISNLHQNITFIEEDIIN